MKRLFLFLLVFTSASVDLFAQLDNDLLHLVMPPRARAREVTVDCNPFDHDGCNHIRNNNFTPNGTYDPTYGSPTYYEPFNYNTVPHWVAAQGTPQIDDLFYQNHYGIGVVWPPPSPATGYAFLAANRFPDGTLHTEGIVQKIKPVIAGHTYALSFFKMLAGMFPSYDLDQFDIRLMRCSDFPLIYNISDIYLVPNPPTYSQAIYCESTINNTSWQQVTTTFIANDNYDMIWIYPRVNGSTSTWLAAVDFAYPELIDVTNFTAGTIQEIAPCRTIIGPTTPNCSVANATFVWHGPNGQTLAASLPSQQLGSKDIRPCRYLASGHLQ